MADSVTYEMSNASEMPSEPFIAKREVWVPDANNGVYSNQLQIETSVLSNSNQYVNYAEAFIQVPLIVAMQATQDITASANQLMVGLKSGYWNLFDSLSCDVQGVSVCNQQPFLNTYISYKIRTSFSQDSLYKYGTAIGFWPDSSTSFSYSGAASVNGVGVTNNWVCQPITLQAIPNAVDAPSAEAGVNTAEANFVAIAAALTTGTVGFAGDAYNMGFAKRLKANGFTPNAGFSGTGAWYLHPQNTGKNFFTNNGAAAANRVYSWNLLCKTRLADLHDFFASLPVLKGIYMKLTLNLNLSTQTTTCTTNTGVMALTTYQVIGRTNPLLVASAAPLNPMNAIATTAGNPVLTISCGIGQLTVGTAPPLRHPVMTSCRLYAPTYTLSPVFEDQYLSLNPTKLIQYTDVYQFTIPAVGPGGNFSFLATTGLVNAKHLVVMPFLSATSNANVPVLQSPFATEGGTTSPILPISNFQVQISGVNAFETALNYDFEVFMRETKEVNSINGGLTQLVSGLVGEAEFSSGYRYFCCNVGRRLPGEDSIPKSYLVSGTNQSTVSVDLTCFLEYTRSIRIEVLSGAIVN